MAENQSFLDKVVAVYSQGSSDRNFSEGAWPGVCQGAEKVESLLEASPPARILDLACGSGSTTIALAMRGYDITGIDCTPPLLETARQMDSRKGGDLPWRCEDMRTLSDEGELDHVCLRDVVFSIFETQEEDGDLIQRMAHALRSGGRCLFEVYNREFAMQHGVEGILSYDPLEDRFMPKNGAGGLSLRLYSPEQWEQMLAAYGLLIVRRDGWSWRGDPPAPPHRADIIVAQKD